MYVHTYVCRYNTAIVERDYYTHFKQHSDGTARSSRFSYADLIIDQSVGVVLRPLCELSSDAGLKALISTTTALSFQFETCWVILYAEDLLQ